MRRGRSTARRSLRQLGNTIEEALRMNYLEIGDTDQHGEVTVRRTSKRAPERLEPVRQAREGRLAPSGT